MVFRSAVCNIYYNDYNLHHLKLGGGVKMTHPNISAVYERILNKLVSNERYNCEDSKSLKNNLGQSMTS